MHSGDPRGASSGDAMRRERGRARTALATPVKDTPAAERTVSARLRDGIHWSFARVRRVMAHPHTIRTVVPWVAVVTLIAVIGTLALMLEDAGRISAVANRPTPTPTPTTLPTPTITPLPSPMAGYKLYPDLRDGFYIQYPESWTISPTSGQVQLDDPSSGAYALIKIPGDWSGPGHDVNQNEASAWVDYVLTTFYGERYPGIFTRETNARPPVTFAGEEWQVGGGSLVLGQVRYRVEVYATIHNEHPYIIVLNASDDQFDSGRDQYFDPMLRSFTFLDHNP